MESTAFPETFLFEDFDVFQPVENSTSYLDVFRTLLEPSPATAFLRSGQTLLLEEAQTLGIRGPEDLSRKAIPGLKLDHPRQLALMHALVRFAHIATGDTFTTAAIHPAVIEALRAYQGGSTKARGSDLRCHRCKAVPSRSTIFVPASMPSRRSIRGYPLIDLSRLVLSRGSASAR